MGKFEDFLKSYMGTGIGLPFVIKQSTIEAKKEGYAEAAKKYGYVYRKLKKEYDEAIAYYDEKNKSYMKNSDELIARLENLEKQRDKLLKELNKKRVENNIPMVKMKKGTSYASLALPLFFLSRQRMDKARAEGYEEARKLYEEKISKLRAELENLKARGDKEIAKYEKLIADILEEISAISMQLADLRLFAEV